jgi:hypothetical protein
MTLTSTPRYQNLRDMMEEFPLLKYRIESFSEKVTFYPSV